MSKFSLSFETGFSVIEVLIACTLSALILLSVYEVYKTSRTLYQKTTSLSQSENNLILATYALTKNIRTAGFAGPARLGDLLQKHQYVEHAALPFDFSLENSLHGFTSQNAPDYLQGKMLSQSDALSLQSAAYDVVRLAQNIKAGANSFVVNGTNPATAGDKILLIAGCDGAELFNTKYIGGSVISLDAAEKLAFDYHVEDAVVGRFSELAYFVGASPRVDARGEVIHSLYVVLNRKSMVELLSGVEDMHITYGVMKDGKGAVESYYLAKNLDDLNLWGDVKSVCLDLTLGGENLIKRHLKLYITLRER